MRLLFRLVLSTSSASVPIYSISPVPIISDEGLPAGRRVPLPLGINSSPDDNCLGNAALDGKQDTNQMVDCQLRTVHEAKVNQFPPVVGVVQLEGAQT
jgi:hypothetical protein